jgi:hypothetical protein
LLLLLTLFSHKEQNKKQTNSREKPKQINDKVIKEVSIVCKAFEPNLGSLSKLDRLEIASFFLLKLS